MIKVSNNRFELKSDSLFLTVGIGATVMECIGLYFFFPIFFEPDDISSWLDIGATAFICLWLGVVLLGAITAFYRYSRRIIIDDDGVSYRSLFGKKHLDWSDVQDYGLSYDGRSQDGADYANMYIIYFAKEKQKNKNQYKQRLSRDVLKVHIKAYDYACFAEYVVPFCKSKTKVMPFIPQDTPHFF